MKTLYLWLIGNIDTHPASFEREETMDYTFRNVGRGFLSKPQRLYIYMLAWAQWTDVGRTLSRSEIT